MDALADNRSLMRRRGGTGWRHARRGRGIPSSDDMKADGSLVGGQKRGEQRGGNLDAEIFVIEFHFTVAGKDAVSAERRMHRYGHCVRFAVEGQVAGDD